MIGVILWSNPDDKKAVIWCEDHGDLAFLSSPENTHLPDRFFEVGDMVEFDISTKRNLRLAHNTKQLAASFGTCIKTVLNAASSADEIHANDGAKVVPLQITSTKESSPEPVRIRRRV